MEFHALKDAQAIFDVNYFGLMRVTQKFLPLLRQSKGRIINVSSILGALTVQELGVYSSSKHAMESLSDALRRELRPLDVSVSVVQPGASWCLYVQCGSGGKRAQVPRRLTCGPH